MYFALFLDFGFLWSSVVTPSLFCLRASIFEQLPVTLEGVRSGSSIRFFGKIVVFGFRPWWKVGVVADEENFVGLSS